MGAFDDLIKVKTVEWSAPLSAEGNARLARIDAIEAGDERAPKEQTELDRLIAELPPVKEIRVTVSTPTNLTVARYRSFRQRGGDYVNAIYPPPSNGTDPAEQDRAELLRSVDQWAICMAVTKAVEERATPYGEASTPWEPTDYLHEWEAPEVYMEQVPPSLHLRWAEAAYGISPGTFGVNLTDFFTQRRTQRAHAEAN